MHDFYDLKNKNIGSGFHKNNKKVQFDSSGVLLRNAGMAVIFCFGSFEAMLSLVARQ